MAWPSIFILPGLLFPFTWSHMIPALTSPLSFRPLSTAAFWTSPPGSPKPPHLRPVWNGTHHLHSPKTLLLLHFQCKLHLLTELRSLVFTRSSSLPHSAHPGVVVLVSQSGLILHDSMDYSPLGSSVHGDSAGKNTGVGCHALLQGNFPTQELNSGLLHCRWILYCLSYQGSPLSSVQFSCSVVSDSLRSHELQHARPPCPSPIPGVYPKSCPSSRWYHPAISSSVVPFSSCPQSFPASGSFPMSQLFTWGGQSIGVSASTSGLPMNT